VLLRQNLTAEALDVVLNMCNTISFSPGEALFRRNDPGDSLYLIERGQVSVMLPFEDGQPARLGSSGAGTVVGEMALYTQQPRSADVIADTTCQARQLTLDVLATMQRDYPDAALQFHRLIVRILAGRLAAANSRLKALS